MMSIDFSPQKQAGATFATGLIFLAVLTLFGTTAMQTSSLEERMSGNLRDRNLAFQVAEMTLRYAEQHIRATNIPAPIEGVTGFDAACTNGLCYYGAGIPAPDESGDPPAWITYCTPNCPIAYVPEMQFSNAGALYTAPALPNGLLAPTYLIEVIRKQAPGLGGGGWLHYYRVTVRAQGARAGTVVLLQEIFRP